MDPGCVANQYDQMFFVKKSPNVVQKSVAQPVFSQIRLIHDFSVKKVALKFAI
jgi:hypothetical protein